MPSKSPIPTLLFPFPKGIRTEQPPEKSAIEASPLPPLQPPPADANSPAAYHRCDRVTGFSKSALAESEFDDLKKNAHMLMSPTALSRMTKSPSIKSNCLCSPTTHMGSFRCRRHRSSTISRGGSVGSNLSDLGQKSGAMED